MFQDKRLKELKYFIVKPFDFKFWEEVLIMSIELELHLKFWFAMMKIQLLVTIFRNQNKYLCNDLSGCRID